MSEKWNCPIDLKNIKIDLSGENEATKEAFQECCFEQGIKWDISGDLPSYLEFDHYGTTLYFLQYWSHPHNPDSSFTNTPSRDSTKEWLDWFTTQPKNHIGEGDKKVYGPNLIHMSEVVLLNLIGCEVEFSIEGQIWDLRTELTSIGSNDDEGPYKGSYRGYKYIREMQPIKEEPRTLEDRIKEAYPDFEVVMVQRSAIEILHYTRFMPSGEFFSVAHTEAQSEKGFSGYVYHDKREDAPVPFRNELLPVWDDRLFGTEIEFPVAWLRSR